MRFIKKMNLLMACEAEKYKKVLPKALKVVKHLSGIENVESIHDLKTVFGKHVDAVPSSKRSKSKDWVCFDLSPEACRLITFVSYKTQAVYFKEILTHKEYEEKYVSRKKRR